MEEIFLSLLLLVGVMLLRINSVPPSPGLGVFGAVAVVRRKVKKLG